MATTHVKCTRKGCGKEFDPSDNASDACVFHPGGPLFHEGLKSWTCCKDLPGHRPVSDFSEFLAIKGCTTGSHSLDKEDAGLPPVAPSPSASGKTSKAATSTAPDGKETYGGTRDITSGMQATSLSSPPAAHPSPSPSRKASPAPPKPDPEDSPESLVPSKAPCKRLTCSYIYAGADLVPRGADPSHSEECTYHPGVPIFHEGSKGYSCCKKRVLEFDEFLELKGCKKGRHLFIGDEKKDGEVEVVELRTDFYQTPTQVIVSVFGKNADKEASKITFNETNIEVQLSLPSSKTFLRTFELFGPIAPQSCTYRIIAPKVELTLQKADGRSWPCLELGQEAGGGSVTFGVGGRTGSVGGKQAVLSGENKK